MKILYLDPILGISGDMMISALLDAGLPFGEIASLLKQIPLPLPAMAPVKMRQGDHRGHAPRDIPFGYSPFPKGNEQAYR